MHLRKKSTMFWVLILLTVCISMVTFSSPSCSCMQMSLLWNQTKIINYDGKIWKGLMVQDFLIKEKHMDVSQNDSILVLNCTLQVPTRPKVPTSVPFLRAAVCTPGTVWEAESECCCRSHSGDCGLHFLDGSGTAEPPKPGLRCYCWAPS